MGKLGTRDQGIALTKNPQFIGASGDRTDLRFRTLISAKKRQQFVINQDLP